MQRLLLRLAYTKFGVGFVRWVRHGVRRFYFGAVCMS